MNKQIIASLFRSMQIGVSGGAGKVHATLGTVVDSTKSNVIYIQLEDGSPRYEHQGEIINLKQKFYTGFGYKKILSWFNIAHIIKKYCNENKINVIIGQGDFFFMITGLSKLLGNRSICVGIVHTTLRIWPKIIQLVLIESLKKNDKIVCISKEEVQFLLKNNITSSKIHLIHNSIDTQSIIHQSTQELPEEDKKLFHNKNIFTYISVGRFTYQKNFQLLVNAFALVHKQNSQTQLIIIGDGDEYESISKQIIILGLQNSIILLGKKNNPMQYMINADCFVMSSRFEGYPMVLLEACVCGLPLVSINCPTGPAEIIGNNEGGILVQYDKHSDDINSKQLSQGMLEIIHHNKIAISNRNKNFAEQFDNKVIGEKWDTFFNDLKS